MTHLPFFMQAIAYWAIKKWRGRTEAVTTSLAIILGIAVIFLTICSVTTIVHNQGTPEQYCTTPLGKKTSCDD